MRPRPKTRNKDHKPAGATSREAEDGEPLPGPKMRNQDGREQPPRSPGAVKMTTQRPAGATSTGDGEPLPGAVKTREDATEAGGVKFHRGRGATTWGREDKRHRDRGRRGQPAEAEDEESRPPSRPTGAN